MPAFVAAVALLIIIGVVLVLARSAVGKGPRTLLALAAVIGAVGTLATALHQYVN
jgi:hypothetical protein